MTADEVITAEQVAHAILKVAGELPGCVGRLRCARAVAGLPIPDAGHLDALDKYKVEGVDWPLHEVVGVVDALLAGGLLAQTRGQRPTLVLTRAGHRALDALEAVDE